MVSSPAVASSDTGQSLRCGSTRVSGPGQNAAASRSAAGSKRASRRASARSATWEISGLNFGRALAANTRPPPLPFPPAAPKPYTVSVGNATSPPSARQRAAASAAAAPARITRVARSTLMVQAPVENADLEHKPRKIQADLGHGRKQPPAPRLGGPELLHPGDIIVLEHKP